MHEYKGGFSWLVSHTHHTGGLKTRFLRFLRDGSTYTKKCNELHIMNEKKRLLNCPRTSYRNNHILGLNVMESGRFFVSSVVRLWETNEPLGSESIV